MSNALSRLISEEFPVKRNFIYLRHAAVCPLPMCCAKAMSEYAFEYTNLGNISEKTKWIGKLEHIRKEAAQLIQCDPDEIALGKNTTWGLLVASLELPVSSGDNVITPDGEFPANYYPWQHLAKKGVEIKYVPQENSRLPLESLKKRITDRTRIITHSTVQYFSGFRQDLSALGKLCTEKNIFLVLDAIQGLGAVPFSIQEARPDFVSADAHKWLLGPQGISLFYVNKQVLSRLNCVYTGWISVPEFMNFDNRPQDPVMLARRFEEGAVNFSGLAGFLASLNLINRIGIDVIWDRIRALTDILIKGLQERHLEIITPLSDKERSGIVTFRPTCEAEMLEQHLLKKNILVSVRNGCIRVSPHFYNDKAEISRFLDALDGIC